MDEDRVLDDNSRYGSLQILQGVVRGVCVGLIFYLLTLPITWCGFLILVFVVNPLLLAGVLMLIPGVGGLIGSYIGYKTGQDMRGCASIGAIVFSSLLIIWFYYVLFPR